MAQVATQEERPGSVSSLDQHKVQTCILAIKVFDWCIKPFTVTDCFDIPPQCSPPVPSDRTVECRVLTVSATVISVTPAPPPAPPGTKTVTARVDVTKEITILDSITPRVVRCTFQVTTTVFETTSLYAPDGTTVQVEATAECGPCQINGNGTLVCCQQGICLQFESKAPVKLCVPAELCTPRECVQAIPPCPPAPPEQRIRLCPTPPPS